MIMDLPGTVFIIEFMMRSGLASCRSNVSGDTDIKYKIYYANIIAIYKPLTVY